MVVVVVGGGGAFGERERRREERERWVHFDPLLRVQQASRIIFIIDRAVAASWVARRCRCCW